MDSLIFSLNATIPLFAVILFSYLFKRRGLLTDGFIAGADKFTFRVLIPALLFRDIATGRVGELFDLRFFLFCIVSTTLMFLAVWLIAELFLRDKSMVGAFTQGSFRSSLAILGVAFAQSIYGHSGMVPLMIAAVVPLYNIYSVIVLTLRPGSRAAADGGTVAMCVRGILTNPLIIAILLGLPFSFLPFSLPAVAVRTLDYFATMATPLALVTIGACFEGTQAIQKLGPTIAASMLKLIVLPGIFLTAAYLMGFRTDALVALLAMLATPSTVTCYIMSKNMGGDAVLSSSIVVMTTALSAFTTTVFIYILRAISAI